MRFNDLSNRPVAGVMFDSAMFNLPTTGWRAKVEEFCKKHPHLFSLMCARILSWHAIDMEALAATHAMVERDYRVYTAVRVPYYPGVAEAVSIHLDDFPGQMHLVPYPDLPQQGAAIDMFCRAHNIFRFYTRDAELCKHIPRSLAFYVRHFDESLLRP